MLFHIDGNIIDKGNTLLYKQIVHGVRMAKMDCTCEHPEPVHHAMCRNVIR